MPRLIRGLLSLALLWMSLGLVAAQGTPVAVGDEVEDSTDNQNVTYLLELEAEQTVLIALDSDDFDAFVEVQNDAGETLDEDDDGGETGFNSLLEFTAPAAGTYSVIVRSFLGTPDGAYTLTISAPEGADATDEADADATDEADADATDEADADATDEADADATATPDTTAVAGGDIAVGDTLEGTAENQDIAYALMLDAGDAIVVDLESDDFDAFLEIESADGNVLADNDDRDNTTTDAQIAYTAPETGTYTLIVRSLFGAPEGEYALTVLAQSPDEESTAEPTAEATPEAPTTQDEDGETTVFAEVAEGNVTYDLQLSEGEVVRFTLVSEDFDPYLQIQDAAGAVLAEDDDSLGNRNAALEFTAPADGAYTVLVRAFAGEANGAFELTIIAVAAPTAAADDAGRDSVLIEDTAEGSTLEYEVDLLAGETVELSLISDEFDPYLEIFNSAGESLAEDDDGGDDVNALLTFSAPAEGTYTLLVRTFVGQPNGDFVLTITPVSPPADTDSAAAEATAPAPEATAEASIETTSEPGDPAIISDTIAEITAYEIDFFDGEAVEMALTSQDFDTYLEVRGPDGTLLAEDDDSGPALNALLSFTAPADGTYTVVVRSYAGTPVGTFELVITPIGGAIVPAAPEVTEVAPPPEAPADAQTLDITDDPQTLVLTDTPQAVVTFAVEADTRYVVKLTASEPLDGTLALSIVQAGTAVATLSATSTDEFSLSYAATTTGTAELTIAYTPGDLAPIEAVISLEAIE